ncbi:L,D-transpeptidase family protein [Streptomyces sp. BG9H]|uniref:L,D-transpeptidase family protein n=1 Tax=Streptomyces anatolicus TaxID=2675858 RepID=A0ABS6YGK4_9ACTN|nr:L,D-transpeptidase family protein [Streptomyces anatolicus]MBW5420547.1 L,D-transpeptidase family protein [Streptomyces anatolicus]
MRPRAVALACAVLFAAACTLGAAPEPGPPLPERMADTGGGSQLITAEARRTGSTTGTLTWWDRRGGRWVEAGSAPARFGAKGLAEGAARRQGTDTTPTGLYGLPYAFGIAPGPDGTAYPYRRVTEESWWCQDNASRSYNRWSEPRAADCRASEAEHLITYDPQYTHAMVIDFNYARPVRGRGAGIFLHVDGPGATAGCVSVPEEAMRAVLRWARPERRPHIAIGTASGPTALIRY